MTKDPSRIRIRSIQESSPRKTRTACSSVFGLHSVVTLLDRFLNIYMVKGVMTYVLTIRNQTHYFGVQNLKRAMQRPEGVGLLTVSNHVTTIDSASLFAPQMHFRDLLETRNCGLWNVAREDQPFGTLFLSMMSPLVKIMPIFRGGGVYQIALSNFIQRVKYGEWCHIFPEGRTYQVRIRVSLNDRINCSHAGMISTAVFERAVVRGLRTAVWVP